MSKIKAILFDFDGTLCIHLPSGGEVFTDFAVGLGLSVSKEDRLRGSRWEHYYFASSPEIKADQIMFKDDSPSFWTNYSRRRLIAMGCHPGQAIEFASKCSKHMAEFYKPQSQAPGELHTILPALKEQGYVLGVVSNRDKPYLDDIKEIGLHPYFDFSLAGGEIPSFKPEPGIFMRALEIAGTDPHETFYVGDNYYADVVGSHRAGLWPVLYDPNTVFPDADCPVIKSFDELPDLILEKV